MYHFDCLQNMYAFDWKKGIKSTCTLCRSPITTPPIKLYGATGFPKDHPFSYEIVKESIQPNMKNNQNPRITGSSSNNTEEVDERISFYEGRLADMEAMAEDYEELEMQIENLETELEETQERFEEAQIQLEATRVQLNQKNMQMARMAEKLFEGSQKVETFLLLNQKLELNLEAARKELDSFKTKRAALEVERLSNEIGSLQSDSFYKNIVNDPEITKEQVVFMLAGMKSKFDVIQGERDKVERDLRFFRLYKESVEKREREMRRSKGTVITGKKDDDDEGIGLRGELVNKEISNQRGKDMCTDENENVTIIEKEHEKETFKNPFIIPNNARKMVPTTLPKGTPKTSRGGVVSTTGTGKKSKIMEMADGRKYFV